MSKKHKKKSDKEKTGKEDPLALFEELAGMDVYLVDQFMKGRIMPDMKILDAGAGGGRNLLWMLRNGFKVWACDSDQDRAEHLKRLFELNAPKLKGERAIHSRVEALKFEPEKFDVVICNAVLHFADDDAHWNAMVEKLWEILKPGGLFFARLATTIGVERHVREEGNGWYSLPDGSRRYLADMAQLEAKRISLFGELLDPIKSTNVQNLRTMTTWVMRKT